MSNSGTSSGRGTSPASLVGGLFISSSEGADEVGGVVKGGEGKRVDDLVGFPEGERSALGGCSGLGLRPPRLISSSASTATTAKPAIPSTSTNTSTNSVLPAQLHTHHTPTSSTSSTLTSSSFARTPSLDPAIEGSTDDDESINLLSPSDELEEREVIGIVGGSAFIEGSSCGFEEGMGQGLGNGVKGCRGRGEDAWMGKSRSFVSLPRMGSRRKERNARGLRVDVRKTFGVEATLSSGITDGPVEPRSTNSLETAGGSLRLAGRKRLGPGLRLGINTDLHRPARATLWSSSRSPNTEVRHSLGPKINSESHSKPAYHDGPVQVVEGVWIGNEESVMRFEDWVGERDKGMVVNVAKELGDPFDAVVTDGQGKGVGAAVPGGDSRVKTYSAGENERPEIAYLKLDWTHGETELAKIDSVEDDQGRWGFDKTIRAMEVARKDGVPILIHCQCGISRSATLVIAYLLYLSHNDLLPPNTIGLNPRATMWQVNDYVKTKSEWIGPNVSLICQLLEWEKALNSQAQEVTSSCPPTVKAARQDCSSTTVPLERDIQSFAKREAEDLDERMRARRSKRRKSEIEGAENVGG